MKYCSILHGRVIVMNFYATYPHVKGDYFSLRNALFASLFINSRGFELTMTLQTLRAAYFQKIILETNKELELAVIICNCGMPKKTL